MKRVFLLVVVFLAQEVFAAATFSFEMPEPRLRIVIPDVPQMKMEPHPLARQLINRFGLDPKFVVGVQPNETTFVMLFPYRVHPAIQFKAFLLSGWNGTHCVEVHVSRTMAAAPENELAESLAKWFQGFRGARIDPY